MEEETEKSNPVTEKLRKLTGFMPTEVEDVLSTKTGKETFEFLDKWAELTRKSLKANKKIMSSCLITDSEGHVLCRFCAEGLPNWKEEHAREHYSDCPIELISDVLKEMKELYKLSTKEIATN